MGNNAPKSAESIMTPANIITMVRICLVPVFVVAIISPWPEWIGFAELDVWKAWIAAGIFVVVSRARIGLTAIWRESVTR